jgi:hypothetical protein
VEEFLSLETDTSSIQLYHIIHELTHRLNISTCFGNPNCAVLYISFAAIKTTYFGNTPAWAAGDR